RRAGSPARHDDDATRLPPERRAPRPARPAPHVGGRLRPRRSDAVAVPPGLFEPQHRRRGGSDLRGADANGEPVGVGHLGGGGSRPRPLLPAHHPGAGDPFGDPGRDRFAPGGGQPRRGSHLHLRSERGAGRPGGCDPLYDLTGHGHGGHRLHDPGSDRHRRRRPRQRVRSVRRRDPAGDRQHRKRLLHRPVHHHDRAARHRRPHDPHPAKRTPGTPRMTVDTDAVPLGVSARPPRHLVRAFWPILVTAALLAVVPLWLGGSRLWMGLALDALVFGTYAIGFNLIFGSTNQLFLAVGALPGVGGFASVLLTDRAGLPLLAGLVIGTAMASALGGVFSWVAVRRSLDVIFTGIVTLAFSLSFHNLRLGQRELTRGETGLTVTTG